MRTLHSYIAATGSVPSLWNNSDCDYQQCFVILPITHMVSEAESTMEWKYAAHDESNSDLQVDIFNAQTTDIKLVWTPAAVPLNTHLTFAKHHADTWNGLNVHTYHHYCSLHSDLHLQTLNLAASISNHRHSTNPVVDEVCVQKICRRAKVLSEAEVGIDFSQKRKHEVSKATMGLIHTHA